ncbi:Anthranilate synthase component 1 [Candidatus Magnetomoraceae bacterium gMMP-15]
MSSFKIISTEKLADIETPVSAYLKLCQNRQDSFLLESVETKDFTGRYSIIAFDPIFAMELRKDIAVTWDGDKKTEYPAENFFNLIKKNVKKLECEAFPGLPAIGSLMGFMGYDTVHLIEKLPSSYKSELPTARLVFPSRFVIFDHLLRIMTLLAIDSDDSGCNEKIKDMEKILNQPLLIKSKKSDIKVISPPKERYCNAVEKGKEYIRAGDVFQVVLSDRFEGETDLNPFEVYRRLRIQSPSPYMFFLNFGDYQLAGSSPETLVKVKNRKVAIMAIAGTRGRSENPEKDKALEKELLACEKECAEHIMLIDLARNDVSKVSQSGSLSVDPYMSVVRYSHVMHIVSQVQGLLREDTDAIDALMAGFPAGTVSGAPKVRAMEIIDELENASRGPYAGAVGYFGPNDAMDTCIAIRIILFQENHFTIQVGAGIVADSIPEMEYKEIQNKAAQSILALQKAAKGKIHGFRIS